MKFHPQFSNLLQFRIFDAEENVRHFSTTRAGGVSCGDFRSMNLGNYSDDDPVKIFENRQTLARMFFKNLDDFIIPHQTHGTEVLLIDAEFRQQDKATQIECLHGHDATITQETEIFLCVITADCVPVLLYDRRQKAVAAIHAGWKGTAGRIVEKTVAAMRNAFGTRPEDLLAAIGPAVGIENYEVGKDVERAFKRNGFVLDRRVARTFPPSEKIHLDLKEINRRELIRLDVPARQIEKTRYNTFKNRRLFFSARRQSVHSGRMLTGIMLKNPQ